MKGVARLLRLVVVVGGFMAAPVLWPEGHSLAQRTVPAASAQARQMSRVPRPLPSNAGRNWGDTFYSFEGRARRVEANFPDGVVRSDRAASGETVVEMLSPTGARVGRGVLTARGSGNRTLTLDGPTGRTTTALQVGMKATLDWTSIQSQLLVEESRGVVLQRRWRNGFVRHADSADNPDDKPLQLVTEFDNGLRATTYRRAANVQEAMGKGTPYFTTVLTRGEDGLGTMHWHPGLQLLAWHFPGLTTGQMTADVLEQAQPGWTFTPTMAWANVQALAFYETNTQRKADQLAGNRPDCPGQSGSTTLASRALNGMLDFMVPSLQANTPGCDWLHWLDDTVLRACCDDHDRCYEKYGCSYLSWFLPGIFNDWRCEACNGAAVFCFATSGHCDWDPACLCRQEGGWYDPVMGYCFNEPIVINLDPRPEKIHLSAPEDGVYFDSSGRGVVDKVSWPPARSSIGFLVLDRNGNGRIDDGREWFGNNTRMRDGTTAAHGFDGLRDLDGGDQSDGAVTKADPWYWELRVWVDRNHNGVSERSELVPLDEAGIEALATDYRESSWIDRNGNVYPYAADVTFRRPNGRTVVRPMYDALLQRAE